jgi:hypothetical protein
MRPPRGPSGIVRSIFFVSTLYTEAVEVDGDAAAGQAPADERPH